MRVPGMPLVVVSDLPEFLDRKGEPGMDSQALLLYTFDICFEIRVSHTLDTQVSEKCTCEEALGGIQFLHFVSLCGYPTLTTLPCCNAAML